MDKVDLVLGSPRGRFFCANVAYLCSTDARAAYPYRPSTLADTLQVIGGVDTAAVADLSEMDLLNALGLATDWARYWQPPDEEDIWFAESDVVNALRPLAAAVLASPRTAWWSEPADLANQRMMAYPYPGDEWPESSTPYRATTAGLDRWREDVEQNEARFRQWRIERPDNAIGGEWWSTPVPSSAVETSRSRPGLGTVQLLLEEDSFGGKEARVWPVTVRSTPRTYEIAGPVDWARLVDMYPMDVSESRRTVWFETTGEYREWFVPDWTQVANHYDAVHLSVLGYLTTPGIAILLAHNEGATVLAGWNPDTTWWLNADFPCGEDEPTLWRWSEDHWRQVKAE